LFIRALSRPCVRSMGSSQKSPDALTKHPLEHTWTLWFDNPNGSRKQTTWGQTLRSVYTFNTIEDFWCLYNKILSPSKLIMGTDFHLFKAGIEPKWEDETCAKGGKWTYLFPKSRTVNELDENWLKLLLAMIGEQFSEPSEICGAVISVRQKQHRIALWTKTSSNEAHQLSVGRSFRSILGLPDNEKINYMVHDDAIRLERKAKERYSV
jgi:translation initiation factor 4E